MPIESVKLQILIRPSWRTKEGLAAVTSLAKSLGINPTSAGTATLSADITPDRFETLFRQRAVDVAPRPPGPGDFGTPGGAKSAQLPVPDALRDYVENITVAPPHLRFEDR